jgi:hypothetical protein
MQIVKSNRARTKFSSDVGSKKPGASIFKWAAKLTWENPAATHAVPQLDILAHEIWFQRSCLSIAGCQAGNSYPCGPIRALATAGRRRQDGTQFGKTLSFHHLRRYG